MFCFTKPSFLSQSLKYFTYSFIYSFLPPSTWTTKSKGEKNVDLWSSLRPPYISIMLSQPQLAPNFLKSGPKILEKLLEVAGHFSLKSWSRVACLVKSKWPLLFANCCYVLLCYVNCRWWSSIMQFKLLPPLLLLLSLLFDSFTAGDVWTYSNCVMSFVLYPTKSAYSCNILQRQTEQFKSSLYQCLSLVFLEKGYSFTVYLLLRVLGRP